MLATHAGSKEEDAAEEDCRVWLRLHAGLKDQHPQFNPSSPYGPPGNAPYCGSCRTAMFKLRFATSARRKGSPGGLLAGFLGLGFRV